MRFVSCNPRAIVRWSALFITLGAGAPAQIVATSGDVVEATLTDVRNGVAENDDEIRAFHESNVVLPAAGLPVDITLPGDYGTTLTPGVIPGGVAVSSFYLHADQTSVVPTVVLQGSITFADPIIGVIITDAGLDGTDAALGRPGTSYVPSTALHGLNVANADWIRVWGHTLELYLPVHHVQDHVRVITGNLMAWSTDFGSDTGFCDPVTDGNEVHDPGDVYGSAFLAGAPMLLDDATYAAVFAPESVDGEPYTFGCSPPGPPTCYGDAYDLDAYDVVNIDAAWLASLPQGQQHGPFFPGQVPREDDQLNYLGIFLAQQLLISFDDDVARSWSATNPLRMPVESLSPSGSTYGQGVNNDEVLEVVLGLGAYPFTVSAILPFRDEVGVHADLGPNPTPGANPQARDDDVDALDWRAFASSVQLFSPDHEGHAGLTPGAIYVVIAGVPTLAIQASQLGIPIPAEVDIDAFELVQLPQDPENPYSPVYLAVLFSVDDNDPRTPAIDETGGLDPTMIYYSFLNNTYGPFAGPFDDDVDAIAALPPDLFEQASVRNYCDPAVPNSTQQPATITVTGSLRVSDNALTLRAENLPPNQFGYFLASQSPGFIQPPGAAGPLCIGCSGFQGCSGIARFNRPAEVIQGPTGSLLIDLSAIPVNPPAPAVPGDTWYFQSWYRDAGSSNFTDAVEVRLIGVFPSRN
ncbi:MAG: hypothetical protein GY711_32995 [bacterium]|nr:hypothetical protein [bacterium]